MTAIESTAQAEAERQQDADWDSAAAGRDADEAAQDAATEAAYQRDRQQEIADTILAQLGGRRFQVMTGASNIMRDGGDLAFNLPAKRGFVRDGINHVEVALTPEDLYRVTFQRIRAKHATIRGFRLRAGWTIDEVAVVSGVYADDLQRVFTAHTGLDCHL